MLLRPLKRYARLLSYPSLSLCEGPRIGFSVSSGIMSSSSKSRPQRAAEIRQQFLKGRPPLLKREIVPSKEAKNGAETNRYRYCSHALLMPNNLFTCNVP